MKGINFVSNSYSLTIKSRGMSRNKMDDSQQAREGKTIGTQGNHGGTTTSGMKGSHDKKDRNEPETIPNQEKSSASNNEKNKS
jgi:hypothetical protein